MFTSKKKDRQKLFQKAMLSKDKRVLQRRSASPDGGRFFSWTAFFLWFSFGIVSGYIFFFSPVLTLSLVEIRGESILPHEEYRKVTGELIEGKYIGFIPRNNFFLFPARTIEERLIEEYPKLKQVTVTRVFPTTVSMYIEESPFLFQWCSGGPCYGVRGGRAVPLPPTEEPRYDSIRLSIIDESALPVSFGKELPVEEYFESFGFIYREIQNTLSLGLERSAMTPSKHARELTLRTTEGWTIAIATDREAERSVRALQVFLEEYQKDHSDRSALVSVDLRVEGKIFFADKAAPIAELTPTPDTKK